jgi:hypothetical protein
VHPGGCAVLSVVSSKRSRHVWLYTLKDWRTYCRSVELASSSTSISSVNARCDTQMKLERSSVAFRRVDALYVEKHSYEPHALPAMQGEYSVLIVDHEAYRVVTHMQLSPPEKTCNTCPRSRDTRRVCSVQWWRRLLLYSRSISRSTPNGGECSDVMCVRCEQLKGALETRTCQSVTAIIAKSLPSILILFELLVIQAGCRYTHVHCKSGKAGESL